MFSRFLFSSHPNLVAMYIHCITFCGLTQRASYCYSRVRNGQDARSSSAGKSFIPLVPQLKVTHHVELPLQGKTPVDISVKSPGSEKSLVDGFAVSDQGDVFVS